MLFLTTEELERQGVPCQEAVASSHIKCSHKLFARAANFPKQERLAAIELSRKILSSGIFSFIAESHDFLTVWQEEKQKNTLSFQPTNAQSKQARAATVAKIFARCRDTGLEAVAKQIAYTKLPIVNSLQPLVTNTVSLDTYPYYYSFNVPIFSITNHSKYDVNKHWQTTTNKTQQVSTIKATHRELRRVNEPIPYWAMMLGNYIQSFT